MIPLMYSARERVFSLDSPEATERVAFEVAQFLAAGDCLLLEGPVGAGKSTFARAVIASLLATPEDIPSPTFTLVQTYETANFEIWHCDLYRLNSSDELMELGLEDAFVEAVTLVEWPDRLGDLAPKNAQRLLFSDGPADDARVLTVSGDARWATVTEALQ